MEERYFSNLKQWFLGKLVVWEELRNGLLVAVA